MKSRLLRRRVRPRGEKEIPATLHVLSLALLWPTVEGASGTDKGTTIKMYLPKTAEAVKASFRALLLIRHLFPGRVARFYTGCHNNVPEKELPYKGLLQKSAPGVETFLDTPYEIPGLS